jgi:two-component system, chemotaxis family, protein-glutamate methylesterase/glutaminase
LKRCGAHVLVQDKASCVVYGMPRLPTEEGLADIIAPLDDIAEEITKLVAQRMAV